MVHQQHIIKKVLDPHQPTLTSYGRQAAVYAHASTSSGRLWGDWGLIQLLQLKRCLQKKLWQLVTTSIMIIIVSGVFSLSAVEQDQQPVAITTLRDFVLAQDKQSKTAQQLAAQQEAATLPEDSPDQKRYQAVIRQLNLLNLEKTIPDIVAENTQKKREETLRGQSH